jgi:hypothetical protein
MAKKGDINNPLGAIPRPAWSANEIRRRIRIKVPGLVDMLVEAAANGDVQAAKILLDKGLGNIKPVEAAEPYVVQNKENPEPEVADAILTGEISPQQAAVWLRVKMLEKLGKEGAEKMTYKDFVSWVQQEVSLDIKPED